MSESATEDDQHRDGDGPSVAPDPISAESALLSTDDALPGIVEASDEAGQEDGNEEADQARGADPEVADAPRLGEHGGRTARVIERPEGVDQPPASVAPQFSRLDCTDTMQVGDAAEQARHALEAGECVVLPTDTVYGIGADAFNAKAVQRLLDAKGRGRDMPPPVLIADASLVRALASDVPQAAEQLTKAFWPGALTVILTARSSSRMDLGETEGTIALRVPDHELARTLLRQTGPMAVSSANLSGRSAALDCDEAIDQLGDRVSVYLDGGRLGDAGRPPSTIVDFSRFEDGQLLRPGAISLDRLREVCPELADLPDEDSPDLGADAGADPATTSEGSPSAVLDTGVDGSDNGVDVVERVRDSRSMFTLQPPKG